MVRMGRTRNEQNSFMDGCRQAAASAGGDCRVVEGVGGMIFGDNTLQPRLKWAFDSCKNGAWGEEPDGVNDAICIRAADFNGDLGTLIDGERTLRSIDDTTYRKVGLRAGDLVVEKSGGGEKQLVGRPAIFNGTERAVCSNFLARCRPGHLVKSEYLNYLMLSIYKARGTYPHIKQTTGIQNLDMASFLNTRVTLPPLATQQRIAAFLDAKTARIDALIAKKQALLEQLAEKRQALITQAVTKGLNPAAPMKDSGIEWLGQIPAHWEIKPLKFLVAEQGGLQMGPFGGMLTELSADPTGYKLYGQENTISGDFSRGNRWLDQERFDFLQRYHLRPCDLVITRKGSLGSCRRFPRDALPGVADSDTIIIRFDESKFRSALAMLLLHDAAYVSAQIEQNRRGAILAGLNTSVVGDLCLICPPLPEQEDVTAWCLSVIEKMDATSLEVSASIQKLSEYRSTLITAAVTGQISDLR